LHSWPQFSTPGRKTLAASEDAMALLLEILKFLGTVALIMVTGLVLLMAG
jgi:hypothetical protein